MPIIQGRGLCSFAVCTASHTPYLLVCVIILTHQVISRNCLQGWWGVVCSQGHAGRLGWTSMLAVSREKHWAVDQSVSVFPHVVSPCSVGFSQHRGVPGGDVLSSTGRSCISLQAQPENSFILSIKTISNIKGYPQLLF